MPHGPVQAPRSIRERIDEYADLFDEDIVLLMGWDDCLVGLITRGQSLSALYDRERIIRRMMAEDGMDDDTAREYFHHNIEGACSVTGGPAFLIDL